MKKNNFGFSPSYLKSLQNDEPIKNQMIFFSNARSYQFDEPSPNKSTQPRTMMIILCYTSFTIFAVFCSERLLKITYSAISSLSENIIFQPFIFGFSNNFFRSSNHLPSALIQETLNFFSLSKMHIQIHE